MHNLQIIKFMVLVAIVGGVFVAGCAASTPSATPTTQATSVSVSEAATPTSEATLEPIAEAIKTATPTTQPTVTPSLSATAVPSSTPTTPPPEATSTPLPEPPTVQTEALNPELAAQGLEIYQQQYCGICHELAAAGTKGIFGPSQNRLGLTAAERLQDPHYSGQATTPAEYIRESILTPDAYHVEGYAQSRHPMPAFTHLTEAQVEALVQFLLQQ